VVEANGSIDRIEILRSVDSGLDNEAIRLIQSMPDWTPGMQGGVTVPVWFTLPINFNIEQGTPNPFPFQKNNFPIPNNSFNRTFPSNRY